MITLRDLQAVAAYEANAEIAGLMAQRLKELDDYTMEEIVFFVIAEPGDTWADIVDAIGAGLFTADACPLWEVIEQHSGCYELVVVLESSGYGAIVFVPDGPDMDADVMTLCRQHAMPDVQGTPP